MALPLLILGDAPTQPSGLGRIARDLAMRIHHGIREVAVQQIGWQPANGSWAPWAGNYPLWVFSETKGWGKKLVQHAIELLGRQGQPEGVVLAVWDAQRAYELLPMPPGWELWLYPAIDAVDAQGSFGGPAAEAIKRADRVVAYGVWSAGVIERIVRHEVPNIPHGIDDHIIAKSRPHFHRWQIGCVATNQPRKDLPLFVQVVSELKRRGIDASGWLHTDRLDGAWPLGSLKRLGKGGAPINITLSGTDATDQVIRERIARCHLTLAPGKGEGFGYPILESLSQGVGCVHSDYAGGAELLPVEWRITPRDYYTDPGYGLRRPILDVGDVADKLMAIALQPDSFDVAVAHARHYAWSNIWPRWKEWILQGVEEFRG